MKLTLPLIPPSSEPIFITKIQHVLHKSTYYLYFKSLVVASSAFTTCSSKWAFFEDFHKGVLRKWNIRYHALAFSHTRYIISIAQIQSTPSPYLTHKRTTQKNFKYYLIFPQKHWCETYVTATYVTETYVTLFISYSIYSNLGRHNPHDSLIHKTIALHWGTDPLATAFTGNGFVWP